MLEVSTLTGEKVINWLEGDDRVPIDYSEVYEYPSQWIMQGNSVPIEDLFSELWSLVQMRTPTWRKNQTLQKGEINDWQKRNSFILVTG